MVPMPIPLPQSQALAISRCVCDSVSMEASAAGWSRGTVALEVVTTSWPHNCSYLRWDWSLLHACNEMCRCSPMLSQFSKGIADRARPPAAAQSMPVGNAA